MEHLPGHGLQPDHQHKHALLGADGQKHICALSELDCWSATEAAATVDFFTLLESSTLSGVIPLGICLCVGSASSAGSHQHHVGDAGHRYAGHRH
mgnify:CR=1 FL=1